MENNRVSVSLPTVIIIIVVICALIFGMAFFIVYNMKPSAENNIEQSKLDKVQYEGKEENVSKEEIISNNDNINTNINSNTTTVDNEVISNLIEGKPSSKQSPLEIGEWSIASKYVSGEYVNVPAKVTNVTRGSTAAQAVKDYCQNSSTIYRYEDAKDGMEWAVIDYNIDLTKIEKDSSGKLEAKITGTGNNSSIKYNNKVYILSTMDMTPYEYTKGKIISCKFAVQLPIGCTEYLIALGSSSNTQAFFKGK